MAARADGRGRRISIQTGEIGIAQHVEPREEGLGGFVEDGPQLRSNRGARRHGEAHRILVHAVDVEFVMQMRTGSQSSAADKTQDFSLNDAPALPHPLAESRQVRVQRFIAIGMAHDHDVAIASLAADEGDMTIGSGAYAGTGGCAIVDTLVRTPCLEYRMESRVGKSGRYAGEFDR